jgi:3-Oxoacyl-[acyl-carrier-protein (ACP)] synthase III
VNRVFIHGLGAVSPAGWSVDSLRDALAKGEPLPVRNLPRPGSANPLRVRNAPPPSPRPAFLSHGRLRRTSPISQFAVSAALEALGEDGLRVQEGAMRLGIVLCVMAGCVNYSRRFYDEALRDPATASPLVFPETVFNAPASHLAAVLGTTEINYTLVGDPGMFLVGLAVAAQWLRDGRVEGCLIVGAEEIDWLVADAARRFVRDSVLSEGAGAVYLRSGPEHRSSIQIEAITDAHSFLQHFRREQAVRAMRAQLPAPGADELLCDSVQGLAKADAIELGVWADWAGPRLSPKLVLGEGLAAGSAWQTVAAMDALRQGHCAAATVSVVGCNQQAVGARFIRA